MVDRRSNIANRWPSGVRQEGWPRVETVAVEGVVFEVVVVVVGMVVVDVEGVVVVVVDVVDVVAVVVVVVEGGGGGRANWAKPGCGRPLIRVNSPPTKTWSAPTAAENAPVGVLAVGFQSSTTPFVASKAARWWRRAFCGPA